MNRDQALAAVLAAALTFTIHLHVWRTPDRRARARADRALWVLARAECSNPAQCPTHHADGTDQ
ncbi:MULTISPECIES: hypothetical protein [Streptomyces]|uniref:hypothetical protein n=1 Tax=Streptomyces TaxID=1883 RepID=UPI000CC35F9C|nr:hypothetical protein [Streptomyces sp. CB02120-2]PJN19285.1 hypothetical protein CG724_11075 [Streptomyces sp. CB02120-2]